MKIDGKNVDLRAVLAWKATLGPASSVEIVDFVTGTPALQFGFRPGKINPQVAIERVKGMLDQSGEMPLALRLLLSSMGLNKSILTVMSDEAIERAAGHLCDYFGCEAVYAAMLLSDREAIQAMGIAGFSNDEFTPITPEAMAAAGARLSELFSPFRDLLNKHARSYGDGRPANPPVNRGLESAANKQLAELQEQMAEKTRDAKRLTKDLAHANATLEKTQAGNKQLEDGLQVARASLAREQAAHQTLAQHFDQAVIAEAQARVDVRVLPWLAPAEVLATEVAESVTGDILSRAEAVLGRQQQADQRYGLRSRLVQERADCLDMIDRLNIAQQESLHPLIELGTAKDALVTRVAELAKILGLDGANKPPAFMPQSLSTLVKEASTLGELAALRADLESGNRLGLLQAQAIAEAYRLIQEACWKLYLKQPKISNEKNDSALQKKLPLYLMQQGLREGVSCLLLIDGHNVLFRLRDMLHLEFDEKGPLSQARTRLADAVVALAQQYPRLETHLWFDSEDARDLSISRNVFIHYSGGTGRNRADNEIVKYLHALPHIRSKEQFELKVLVTADHSFAEEARTQDVVILMPEELGILVSAMLPPIAI